MNRQQRARFGRWVAGILAATVIVMTCWAVVRALAELFAEPQGTLAGQQRLASGSKESGLAITGWIAQNRARQHAVLRCWYKLSNHGSSPLRDLRLHLHAPGFRLPQPPRGGPLGAFLVYLIEKPDRAIFSSALPELAPGSNETLWVDLEAAGRSGDSMLTAWFIWSGSGGEPHGEVLELGPVALRSGWLEQTAAWKDFALAAAPLVIPILLLALGFQLQSRQQRFVQERQAWAAMLPLSYKNSTRSYVPLIGTIRTLEWRLSLYHGKKDNPSLRQSAFFFLLLAVRGSRTVDANGGYYLQDRQGEKLIARCWDLFLESLYEAFDPYEGFSSVVDTVKPQDSVSSFAARARASSELQAKVSALEVPFAAWVDKSEQPCSALVLASVLLEFEINRINQFWYGEGYEEHFPLSDAVPLLAKLCREGGALADRAPKIYQYAAKTLTWGQRRTLKSVLQREKIAIPLAGRKPASP